MDEEYLLGSGMTFLQSKTFFLSMLVGGLMVWSAWAVYSLFKTYREDKSNAYGLNEFVVSVVQVLILDTIVIASMLV